MRALYKRYTLTYCLESEYREMAILQVYLDESGPGRQSAAYVVAGFVASVEAWLEFSHAWQAVLGKPPPIKVLKARMGMHETRSRADQ